MLGASSSSSQLSHFGGGRGKIPPAWQVSCIYCYANSSAAAAVPEPVPAMLYHSQATSPEPGQGKKDGDKVRNGWRTGPASCPEQMWRAGRKLPSPHLQAGAGRESRAERCARPSGVLPCLLFAAGVPTTCRRLLKHLQQKGKEKTQKCNPAQLRSFC